MRASTVMAVLTMVVSAAAAPLYTMDDLVALDKLQSWQELYSHLGDVPPSKRNDQWNAMLERAATGLLSAPPDGDGWAIADGAVKQYPSLVKSKRFMSLRADVGVHGIVACVSRAEAVPCNQRPPGDVQLGNTRCARPPDVSQCVARALGFLDSEPAESEFGMGAAKAIAVADPFSAVHVYKRTAAARHDAKRCADPDLAKSVTWTFNLASPDARVDDAKVLASDLCWDQLAETLVAAFANGSSNYRHNTCPFLLSKKNALSPMSTRECQHK